MELLGKVAMVTGGSRGIGAAIARRLADDGADIAVTYQQRHELADAVVRSIRDRGRRAIALRVDSADVLALREAVGEVVASLGRLDIVVNNAGVPYVGGLEQVTVEDLDRVLAVNVKGAFAAAQAAVPHLGTEGRIVNIGSCLAERVPFAGMALYAASKSALIGMTRGLARDLGGRGITVNLVHPGPTDTEMNPAGGESADFQRSLTALGRYASADEVAETVRHLVGPHGAYITGSAISVDGGTAA